MKVITLMLAMIIIGVRLVSADTFGYCNPDLPNIEGCQITSLSGTGTLDSTVARKNINNFFTTSQTVTGIVRASQLISEWLITGDGSKIYNLNLTGYNLAYTNIQNTFTATQKFMNIIASTGNFNSSVTINSRESVCLGTPIVTNCSIYENQTSCELRESHGSCSWSATGGNCIDDPGMDCSIYDEGECLTKFMCSTNYDNICSDNPSLDCSTMDEGTCTSNSAGCTTNYVWSSCSGSPGCENYMSQGDCESDPNAYGGCSNNFNYNGCTTTGSCSSFSSGGCPTSYGCQVTQTFNSCSNGAYACNSFDQYSDCSNINGCSWNSSYSCIGTADCEPIQNKSNCLNETGCQWFSPAPNILLGSYKTQNITQIYFDGNDTQFLSNGAMYFPNSSLYAKGFNTLSKVYDKTTLGDNSLTLSKDSSYYKKPDGTLNYPLHPAYEQIRIEGRTVNTLSMETRIAIMEQQIYDLKRCALMNKFEDMRICILGG